MVIHLCWLKWGLKFCLITYKSICSVLDNAQRARELYEDKWDVTQGVEM